MLNIRISGHEPAPQERPRTFKTRGRTVTVSPKSPWYFYVLNLLIQNRPPKPLDGPIGLEVDFIFERPKAKKYDLWVTKRPDLDNLVKAIKDAGTKAGWWLDDSLVVYTRQLKRYATHGEGAGAVITAYNLPATIENV